MLRVLFVCMGNICRSPMAEGAFRNLIETHGLEGEVEVDSAGTHAYHVDMSPDERAIAVMRQRGIDISGLRGRQATSADIEAFDYILAMDYENHAHLRTLSPSGSAHKIRLFLEYAVRHTERSVPDPYFGPHGGFDRVLDMIEDATGGLLVEVRRRLNK